MAIVSVVSGYDDLFYDVSLTDESTGQALAPAAAGTVSVILCRINTTTPLGATATQNLTSQGSGRWTGLHDDTDVLAALTAGNVAIGQRFDVILQVGSLALRRLGSCQRVAIVNG
jgi:hypothetical protein